MNIEDTALEACKEASRRIAKLNDRNKVVGVGAYGDETLLADRIAEETIIEILSSRSKLSFLSEERGFVNNQSDYIAIIDPLDGSSNYRNGIPFFAISIALYTKKLEPLQGFVYFPLLESFYSGKVGRGSYLNGRKIISSKTKEISKATVCADISRTSRETIIKYSKLLSSVKRVLHFGANALELCFVAEGIVDCFIDPRNMLRITDIAASMIIMREAGAYYQELEPSLSLNKRYSVIACSNKELYLQLTNLLVQ